MPQRNLGLFLHRAELDALNEVLAAGTVDEKRQFLRAFIRRVELDPDTGRGRAELYSLPTQTASSAKDTNDAANSSLIMVAGAGYEPDSDEPLEWEPIDLPENGCAAM